MIDRQKVVELANEWLADKEYFLVDVIITKDDKITVEIDHAEGVWIEDCAELSRHIESGLSRDSEDYELEVGSAGLGQPFKVVQQYKNHIGLEVEVLGKDGKKLSIILHFKTTVFFSPFSHTVKPIGRIHIFRTISN